MAFCLFPTFHLSTIPRQILPPCQPTIRASSRGPKFSQCMAIATSSDDQTIVRRVANYHLPIWEYDYIQSLTSKYQGDTYRRRADKLKEEVRMMLNKEEDPLCKLELVDTMRRLGIFYHFESILDEAKDFAAYHLNKYLKKNMDNMNYLAILVSHALERPLHWRVPRLEARWFIDMYEKKQGMNTTILQFAKLDFNMVQAIHLEDPKYMSRWWEYTCLGEKLGFARDRLMENFIWTVGVNFEPQFQYWRRKSTEVNSLITIIDDVYDVYGTMDELKLFTNAVERWDVNAIDQLPDYMKICFLALFNSINDMAYGALKEQNFNIIPYLKNTWIGLCKSYLVEAKWYDNKYTPTLKEYLENAWISISAPTILMHAYSLISNPLTKDALECLEKYPNLVRWSSMILRLSNDLGTSKDELKRGDIPKSIQCYMHETGASEEKAREHIHYLISETWKKMNEDRVIKNSPFNQIFVETALNLARMAQCMYEHGDGHGIEHRETKDRILSLIINPIPLV
ncbi:hypothetical protein LguiA_024666 [Lonicera macranthoides]